MKSEIKKLLSLLENNSNKEVAEHLNGAFNYYGVESMGNPANYYEITENYSITIDFTNEDIYDCYYELHQDELKRDLEIDNTDSKEELIGNILKDATHEEIAGFYEYSFEEIDQVLAERYVAEHKDELIGNIKAELEYL